MHFRGLKSKFLFGDNLIELVKCEELIGFSLIENVSVMHHFFNLLIIHCFS